MTREIVGHAIVSAEGNIADARHLMPPQLRSDADWQRFQAALDAAALVVLGRLGHEMHPNCGRRRLVVTSRSAGLEPDPSDLNATFWNPAALPFEAVLDRLDLREGAIAVTGGTRVFDLFLDRFTSFDLAEIASVSIPDGVPCFGGGAPAKMLAGAGLRPNPPVPLDARTSLTVWTR